MSEQNSNGSNLTQGSQENSSAKTQETASEQITVQDLLKNGEVDGTNLINFLNQHNSTLQARNSEIKELKDQISSLRNRLGEYSSMSLLAEYEFDPKRYETILSLCNGVITGDKLNDLKAQEEFAFLLVRQQSQRKQRQLGDEDNRFFRDILKSYEQQNK